MELLLGHTEDALESMDVSTKQQRIAHLAKLMPTAGFTSLAYYIDVDWLRVAYQRVRKHGAAGVDGVTAAAYEQTLEQNLRSLLERFKSGRYVAPPVKRVYIPKGDGRVRPIGIPALEDKILQRAVVMVLQPLFEADFLECSYGFRPGRSVHDALHALRRVAMRLGGCWVLEVDIQSYFDTVEHGSLREFVKARVRDGVILRTVDKWLKAGVLEDGAIHYPSAGTPQGGVISPLLSNLYLHVVLDTWFTQEIRPRLAGEAELLRFADDYVILCTQARDAHRLAAVLPKRFGKYGLTLQSAKTRLVDFHRPPAGRRKSATFTFLGFTHYWGRSRRGHWVVKRKTAKQKLAAALRRVSQWCAQHRCLPVKEQWWTLCIKVRGHYQFYGIRCNWPSLNAFYRAVQRCWRKWLNRRSRNRDMPWPRFARLLERYPLPRPRITHQLA